MADASVTDNAEQQGPTAAGPVKPAGSIVPFSMKFLGLRLRLAFTKRRFDEVEAIYRSHVDDTGTSGSGTPTTSSSTSSSSDEQARLTTAQQLVGIFDESFGSLREEILAIEQGQEIIQKKILPKLLAEIELHDSFMVFLQGFYMESRKKLKNYEEEEEDGGDYIQECEEERTILCEDDGFTATLVEDNMDMEEKQNSGCGYCDVYEEEEDGGDDGFHYNQEWELENEEDTILCDHDEDDDYLVNLDDDNMELEEEDERNSLHCNMASSTPVLPPIVPKCHLPMLNMGEETSTAVKQLIAEFAGVPTQGALHDMRSLASMLGRGRFPSNRPSYVSMGSTSTTTLGVASAPSTTIVVLETVNATASGDESALTVEPSLSSDP